MITAVQFLNYIKANVFLTSWQIILFCLYCVLFAFSTRWQKQIINNTYFLQP